MVKKNKICNANSKRGREDSQISKRSKQSAAADYLNKKKKKDEKDQLHP